MFFSVWSFPLGSSHSHGFSLANAGWLFRLVFPLGSGHCRGFFQRQAVICVGLVHRRPLAWWFHDVVLHMLPVFGVVVVWANLVDDMVDD